MTQDEIIEMARQAASHGVENHKSGEVSFVFYNEHLMNFAKLVEDKTRQELRDELVYKWVPPSFVDFAVKAEREACAKVCEEMRDAWVNRPVPLLGYAVEHDGAAKAIRARGEA